MDVKIEKLLERFGIGPQNGEVRIATADYRRLLELIVRYDALAEFVEHGGACSYGIKLDVEGVQSGDDCSCGLAEAQRRVAEILERL